MELHYRIRAIAGFFILASLALAYFVNANFLWFTAFVGGNLLQSAFTRWCLMEDILRWLGWDGGGSCCGGERGSCCGETKEPAAK